MLMMENEEQFEELKNLKEKERKFDKGMKDFDHQNEKLQDYDNAMSKTNDDIQSLINENEYLKNQNEKL